MKRRELLKTTLATGASTVSVSKASERGPLGIVDTNISLFRWPFRRLPLDETSLLIEKYRELGIVKTFAGSFEGILQRDISAVNTRLAAECEKHPQLLPMGSINPMLPGWEEDVKRCQEIHGMSGIRLYPNYHGYTLADRCFSQLLTLANDAGMFVQIAAVFEDVRTQPDLLRVADTQLQPLLENHGVTIQILNYRPKRDLLEKLAEVPSIYFDTARIDQTDGVAQFLKTIPPERVLFGTHAPFLLPEASLIRVHESGLPDATLRMVMQSNAEALLR
ncbi:MAG: amidohydrolase family protein [Verrucomicrobiales bacterium]|nr:amidohydrolase family protein [Verrucomicrobiales bacterium]